MAGGSTRRQLVVDGNWTLEVYMAGKGKITVERGGPIMVFNCVSDRTSEVKVRRGDIIQLHAAVDSDLIVAEFCEPPFEEGRFVNVDD